MSDNTERTLRFVEGEENFVSVEGELTVVVADIFDLSGQFSLQLSGDSVSGQMLEVAAEDVAATVQSDLFSASLSQASLALLVDLQTGQFAVDVSGAASLSIDGFSGGRSRG